MFGKANSVLVLSGLLAGVSTFALAEAPANLLALATVENSLARAGEDTGALVANLIDGNAGTVAVFEAVDGMPIDLLFAFERGTVAPETFSLTLSNDARIPAPARIDILASTASASSGFSSLRAETIDPLKPVQKARFGSGAADWLLVRLYPARGAEEIALADLSIGGKEGFPETRYAFGETPITALEIVAEMQTLGAADLKLTAQEAAIFARAGEGNLTNAEFMEIALLASGVMDGATRSDYIARVNALTAEAKSVLDLSAPRRESGAQLLTWLHTRAFQGGYREAQTNLSGVLDDGVFNCVSSAVLYNAVAGGLGFDIRAIEVPDHAFSIVYDGLNHMDVETTTAEGFDPRRKNVADFENLTGFRYIPQSNKSKRREIGAAGLAALIYYNHGVEHLRAGRYQDALFANFRAMSLDPEFASAATNALAALGRWSTSLADVGNWEDATEVAAVGARLAPEDRGLAATRKAIWQRWAFAEAHAGRPEAALDILATAADEIDRDTFDGLRAAVFTRPAEDFIDAGDWQGALDATLTADALLDPQSLGDLREWRGGVYQRWASAELDAGRFPNALEVLQAGSLAYPGDRNIARATRYLAQEWAKAEGFPKGLDALQSVKSAVPDITNLDEIAETFLRRHIRAGIETVTLEAALADVAQVGEIVGPNQMNELTAFAFEAYGHARIDAEDWAAAAEIYAEGRKAVPDSKSLARNARYVAQEWQRQANAEGGVAALEAVQRTLRALFPDFAVDPGFGEDEIIRQVNAALRSGDTGSAEEILASAQLLTRLETYQELQTVIFDYRARDAMDAGNWEDAAEIYHAGRMQLGDPKLFSQNIAYIAQEWTRSAAQRDSAAGVAEAMDQLLRLFPQDKKVAGMGVTTLNRMIAQHVETGDFEAAKNTVGQARRVLSQEEAGELLVTLYVRSASKAIDEARWEEALTAYADGLAIAPDARDLKRNVPFVFQEWSHSALTEGGASLFVTEVTRMEDILPGTKSLQDVLENVLGRAATDLVDRADPEGALALIHDVSPVLADTLSADLKAIIYDRWARSKFDAEAWQEAIGIYDMGLLEVPDSRLLKNNRRYAEGQL